MDIPTLIAIAALTAAAILTVWFAIIMAVCETAIGRVSRSTLNNMVVEVQTNDESDFVSRRKLKRIHAVQKFVTHRYATAASCSFMRIVANICEGVFIAVITQRLS